MRPEIEKRLHRVKIKIDKKKIECPISKNCIQAENCFRCKEFYMKCTIYKDFCFK